MTKGSLIISCSAPYLSYRTRVSSCHLERSPQAVVERSSILTNPPRFLHSLRPVEMTTDTNPSKPTRTDRGRAPICPLKNITKTSPHHPRMTNHSAPYYSHFHQSIRQYFRPKYPHASGRTGCSSR